eukprot:CAMPEP_0174363030 /NCGR_PEP_ID=MMETSP0811_2-20130205/67052_1 /TAXON_ID=73025 ORGANISM="Eutreptiella gymnastica-like, Strain CCMP1594" /NCGR_SAMPLE_ID=MMETSP0811_2 /ASSEMBLY_ACC=CAM_ASM_000667 /LENGTH=167 /DNA_ID=CAMNT_0015501303 /DNA_START=240 /DNA_END=740 /DNA_ORIENTATION=-
MSQRLDTLGPDQAHKAQESQSAQSAITTSLSIRRQPLMQQGRGVRGLVLGGGSGDGGLGLQQCPKGVQKRQATTQAVCIPLGQNPTKNFLHRPAAGRTWIGGHGGRSKRGRGGGGATELMHIRAPEVPGLEIPPAPLFSTNVNEADEDPHHRKQIKRTPRAEVSWTG